MLLSNIALYMSATKGGKVGLNGGVETRAMFLYTSLKNSVELTVFRCSSVMSQATTFPSGGRAMAMLRVLYPVYTPAKKTNYTIHGYYYH